MNKETLDTTPTFTVIDKDHKIQKQVDELKEMLESQNKQIPLIYCRAMFAGREEKIIGFALDCLKAYLLKQLVSRESQTKKTTITVLS